MPTKPQPQQKSRIARRLSLAMLLVAGGTNSHAAQAVDFTDLSLQELMSVQITSVSKRQESLSGAAAAIHVVTSDDLKRNGIRSVPEALRLVPGMAVARINSSTWAISSRGSNSRFANKLLVLIDGRSVYTPLFSGVFWDRQDTLIEDIDRIEVIRGPGASLWGANAVNGVINIITKNAAQTQGGFVEAGGGQEEAAFGGFRYGDTIRKNGHYRVYAKGTERGSGKLSNGEDGGDEWRSGRGGFRADLGASDGSKWRIQGDAYSSVAGEKYPIPILTSPYSENRSHDREAMGGNLLLGWERSHGKDTTTTGQVFLDHNAMNDARIAERRSTFDVELSQKFPIDRFQLFQWGAGYRQNWDRIENGRDITFNPTSDTLHLFSAFVQDTIQLDGPALSLTIGTKVEHNDYTGLEFQPSARLAWEPEQGRTYWLAVSRAIRTPSRAENDVTINSIVLPPNTPANPSALPALVRFQGGTGTLSERLIAFELGTRWQFGQTASIDAATFYNLYDRLITATAGTATLVTTPTNHLVIPYVINNTANAAAYGLELFGNWQAASDLILSAGYTFFEGTTRTVDGNSPNHQFQIRSRANLSERTTFDMTARYVDNLPAIDVDSYIAVDARVAHKLTDQSNVALLGKNLLSSGHFEYASDSTLPTRPTKAERALFVVFEHKF